MALKVTDFGNAIRSQTRLDIIKILLNKDLRSVDVFEEYKKRHPEERKHRESIYKELQILNDAGLLDKRYDARSKGIVYSLKIKSARIDFGSQALSIED